MKKYRYKIIKKDGRSVFITSTSSPLEQIKWKNAYNKNYANGRRASKSEGILKVIQIPLVKKRMVKRKQSNPLGWF